MSSHSFSAGICESCGTGSAALWSLAALYCGAYEFATVRATISATVLMSETIA